MKKYIYKKFQFPIPKIIEMHQQTKKKSKHASIHDIMSENKRHLQSEELAQLFSVPDLSEMDLNQLSHHAYKQADELFAFFVHELELWNCKVRNREVKPFYHAELKRNLFVLSSLKIICLKKPTQIRRYLQELNQWYQKNSYHMPQSPVLMRTHSPNQEWEIRKTFKFNASSEYSISYSSINNYRRRFLCSPDDKDSSFAQNFLQLHQPKENCFFQYKPNKKTFPLYKTLANDFSNDNKLIEPFQQVMKNKDIKLAKRESKQMRQMRQKQEVAQVQDSWKSSHSRFAEKTCKNFFKGKFTKKLQFNQEIGMTQARKVQTAAFGERRAKQIELIESVKKGRIMTSMGMRKSLRQQQPESQQGQRNPLIKTESNQEAKEESTKNWIDKFEVDEDSIDLKSTWNGEGPQMRLMSNPFEIGKGKLKKKKR